VLANPEKIDEGLPHIFVISARYTAKR